MLIEIVNLLIYKRFEILALKLTMGEADNVLFVHISVCALTSQAKMKHYTP